MTRGLNCPHASGHWAASSRASTIRRDVSRIFPPSSDRLTIRSARTSSGVEAKGRRAKLRTQLRPAQGWLPNTSHLREWHPPTSPNSPINRMDADTAHLAYSFCTRPGMVITPTGRRYRAAHVPNLAEPACLPSTSRCWSSSSSPDPTS
jgi:hypothetical protein